MCSVWGCVNPKYMLTDYCQSGKGCFPVSWGKVVKRDGLQKKINFTHLQLTPMLMGVQWLLLIYKTVLEFHKGNKFHPVEVCRGQLIQQKKPKQKKVLLIINGCKPQLFISIDFILQKTYMYIFLLNSMVNRKASCSLYSCNLHRFVTDESSLLMKLGGLV